MKLQMKNKKKTINTENGDNKTKQIVCSTVVIYAKKKKKNLNLLATNQTTSCLGVIPHLSPPRHCAERHTWAMQRCLRSLRKRECKGKHQGM